MRCSMTFPLCGEKIRRGDQPAAYTLTVLSGADRFGCGIGMRAGKGESVRGCGYLPKLVHGRIPPSGFSDTELPRLRRYPY